MATLPDAKKAFLAAKGFTGSLPDAELAYYLSGGGGGGGGGGDLPTGDAYKVLTWNSAGDAVATKVTYNHITGTGTAPAANTVLVFAANGTAAPTGMATTATANTIAQRGAGGVLTVGEATSDAHAVTRGQMNTAIAAATSKAPVELPPIADPIDSEYIQDLYAALIASGYFKATFQQ